MNEFGEVGIDGALLPGEDFDLLEINNGSIFCICVKKDFLTALQRIVTEIRPDILIMESTGVANPADLAKDLQLPLFRNRLTLREQFCIVDAAYFEEAYEVFASVEKQIETSTIFLINKVDLATAEQLKRVKELIEKHHPDPVLLETTYCDVLEGRILESLAKAEAEPSQRPAATSRVADPKPGDIDEIITQMLDDPDRNITPPDRLVSAVFRWRGDSLGEFERMAAGIPTGVIRAKGFFEADGRAFLFHYVMGKSTVEAANIPANRPDLANRLCFIMPPEILTKIDEFLAGFPVISRDDPKANQSC